MSAYISLGSNVGDRRHYLEEAVRLLGRVPRTSVIRSSPVYRSEALTLDGEPGPDYLNAVCQLETGLMPRQLLWTLRSIEARLGRVRHTAWGPRTVDLDLLAYEDCIHLSPELTLPHPELPLRDFILVPLRDIAPHWRHPVLQKSVSELLEELAESSRGGKVVACCGSLSSSRSAC